MSYIIFAVVAIAAAWFIYNRHASDKSAVVIAGNRETPNPSA